MAKVEIKSTEINDIISLIESLLGVKLEDIKQMFKDTKLKGNLTITRTINGKPVTLEVIAVDS